MSIDRILRAIAAACVVAVLASTPAQATQVRLVNLDEMTRRAEQIFSGRCLEAEVVHDSEVGGDVTVAKFEVQRTVKGSVGATVTVRMATGGDTRAGDPAGVPGFRVGDEVVLFLYGESSAGLTSPVGLGQGRFRIVKDKEGRQIATNDLANKNLLQGLSPAAQARIHPTLASAPPADALGPATLMDLAAALAASGP